MSLDTGPTEAAIEAEIKTTLGHDRVYVTQVPDGLTPKYPYVVLYYGEPIRSARDRHITTTRDDVLVGYVTVQVISTTDSSANAVKNRIKNALTGFRPIDSGEMVLEGGMAYSDADTRVSPTRYFRELGFTYRTNLTGG